MDIGSILIFILGIIASVLITKYFSTRKKLIFVFNTKYIKLSEYGLRDLNITYKEKDLLSLSITRVIIKNIGNRTIEGSDIAENDMICIKCSGFLESKIIKSSPANNVTCKYENNRLFIKFDYTDKNDEIDLYLFQDTYNAKNAVLGKIKGCKLIQSDSRHPYLTSIINIIMTSIISLLAPAFLIFESLIKIDNTSKVFLFVFLFAISVLGIWGLYFNSKNLINTVSSNKSLNSKKYNG